MLIAPWLEPPLALDGVDLREGGPMTETAAIVGGQVWVRECLAAGYCIADRVTVTYMPPDGDPVTGDGFRVTSIRRDEPGVLAAGRR